MSALSSVPAARTAQALFRRVHGGHAPVVARAPGRVNLIGDHTDYTGGLVLPTILGQATYVALRPRSDDRIVLATTHAGGRFSAPLEPLQTGDAWHRYVHGVAALLARAGYSVRGFEAALHSAVPVGSGLSSSAALEVAVLLALEAAFGFTVPPVEAARLCQRVEHEVIGVQCGLMDQLSVRLGRAGHALLLDCRTDAYEHVPLRLDDHRFVVLDSGVPRTLAASAYNERRAACEDARNRLGLASLRDLAPDDLDRAERTLPDRLVRRVRHVVTENDRVRRAAEALRHGDAAALGALMNASHASLRDDYAVSTEALDLLAREAVAAGALGARLTGAGFGGCLVLLVPTERLRAAERHLTQAYTAQTGHPLAWMPLANALPAGIVR